MKEKALIDDFSDEELKEELEFRGFNVLDDCELDEIIEENVEDTPSDGGDKKEDGLFVKKDFLGYELRDHLLEITGQGGWVSDEELFDKLRELIK